MLKFIKKILIFLAVFMFSLPWRVVANDYVSVGGSEYDPDTLPKQLVVGQTGQIRRPQDSPLRNTTYSFHFYDYDPSMISFDEQGNWMALKAGKTQVSFSISQSDHFYNELQNLGLGNLKIIEKEVHVSHDIMISADAYPMYRLYNPNSGEHFYTANGTERDHLSHLGWIYEGIGWYAPISGVPVYRLYNPNTGDHHYTTSKGESSYLDNVGWNYEGIGWYSGGSAPIHRLYNPNAKIGSHHFTLSKEESDYLDDIGWNYEGIGWFAVK